MLATNCARQYGNSQRAPHEGPWCRATLLAGVMPRLAIFFNLTYRARDHKQQDDEAHHDRSDASE
jgi:hypothetical protein